MFEKVNPAHPDKVADRIAGAIVDLAYKTEENPRIAVEVLLGHGVCHAIIETDTDLNRNKIKNIIKHIAGNVPCDFESHCDIEIVPQDGHLSENCLNKFRLRNGVRCGDNGIFKGMPVTEEQKKLTDTAKFLYSTYPYDGCLNEVQTVHS